MPFKNFIPIMKYRAFVSRNLKRKTVLMVRLEFYSSHAILFAYVDEEVNIPLRPPGRHNNILNLKLVLVVQLKKEIRIADFPFTADVT